MDQHCHNADYAKSVMTRAGRSHRIHLQREISRTYRTIAAACGGTIILPSLATAQQPHSAAVGDLMTAFVQPATSNSVSPEMSRTGLTPPISSISCAKPFADLAEILPRYRDLSIPDLITSTVKQPLAALDRAIQARDGNQFTAAYAQLTASCNGCHQSYDRAVIMIQPPTVSVFPDQDFRPSAN
jgi:hypothetical protein